MKACNRNRVHASLVLLLSILIIACVKSKSPLEKFIAAHKIYQSVTLNESPGRSLPGLKQFAKENNWNFSITPLVAKIQKKIDDQSLTIIYEHFKVENMECALTDFKFEIPGKFNKEESQKIANFIEQNSDPKIKFKIEYANPLDTDNPIYTIESPKSVYYKGTSVVLFPKITVRHQEDKILINWNWPTVKLVH